MNKWIRFAARIAFTNKNPAKNFTLGAVLVKSGSVISTGVNKRKTDPIIRELCIKNKLDTRRFRTWMHAELDCINRIPYEVSKGSVIYVARITCDMKLANAKPCKICENEIKKAGIKRVHYTFSNNTEVMMYLNGEEEFIFDESANIERNDSWKREVLAVQCN